MANTTSQTSIIDRALQILGYQAVSSIQQPGSRGAKAMKRAYQSVLLSELNKNDWYFAIKRAQLPATTAPPTHTKGHAYNLPADFLRLAPEDQEGEFPIKNDWIMEGRQIITDDEPPLLIRYISSEVNEAIFDATFAEALSAALAIATVEELTNSNTKLANIAALYDEQIGMARRRGFILIQKPRAPVSPWISKRG